MAAEKDIVSSLIKSIRICRAHKLLRLKLMRILTFAIGAGSLLQMTDGPTET